MKILSNFSYVRRIIVTIILLFQYNIYPQNFSSEVDTVNVKIGEKISYSINYELDSLIEIPLPKDIDFLPLELIEEFDLDTVLIDEKYFFKKKYSLLKFDPGTYFIPSFKFDLKGKIFKVDSIKVNINPVIVDTTKQKLYDLKPMIENTSFWIRMLAKYNLDYSFWISIFFVLVVFIFLIVFKNKIINFFKIDSRDVDYLTPYEKFQNSLNKLKNTAYNSNDDIKLYYSNLTYIFRNFIEKKVFSNALESTSDELIDKFNFYKNSGKFKLTSNTIKNLKEVLSTADLVKFAKYEPDQYKALNDFNTIEKEVKNIKLLLPKPSEKEILENLKTQELLRQNKLKKRNRKIVISSLLALILSYLIFSIIFGFTYVKDFIFRNQNLIYNESSSWISSNYGSPPIFISTPEVLERKPGDYYFTMDSLTIDSQFTFNNFGSPLNIIITNIKLPSNSNLPDLQNILDNTIESLEVLDVQNIITKYDKFITPNDAQGIVIYGSADFPSQKAGQYIKTNYKIFGFINENDFKQIFISWQNKDDYINLVVDRIIDSIELLNKEK